MATQTLQHPAPSAMPAIAAGTTFKTAAEGNVYDGDILRSVPSLEQSKYASAVPCIDGDGGPAITPLTFSPFMFHLQDNAWHPYFGKWDKFIIDPALEPKHGSYVAAGNVGEPLYLCRYETNPEGGYTLYAAPGKLERLKPLPVIGTMIEHIQGGERAKYLGFRTEPLDDSGAVTIYVDEKNFTDRRLASDVLRHVHGDIVISGNQGDVYIDGELGFSGVLYIGEGTTLHVTHHLKTYGEIAGGGSLLVDGRIEADVINITGNIAAKLSITAKKIEVEGDLTSGDNVNVRGDSGLRVGGNLTMDSDLYLDSGDLYVGGNAHVFGVHAYEVNVTGNMRCDWWLIAAGDIHVDGDLTVEEQDLRANGSITVGGELRVGNRIFAGLETCEHVDTELITITCSRLAGGTVAYGKLVETAVPVAENYPPPPIPMDRLHSIIATANQRYIDTRDELWRESRDAVMELLRIRREVAKARHGLTEVAALTEGARISDAAACPVQSGHHIEIACADYMHTPAMEVSRVNGGTGVGAETLMTLRQNDKSISFRASDCQIIGFIESLFPRFNEKLMAIEATEAQAVSA